MDHIDRQICMIIFGDLHQRVEARLDRCAHALDRVQGVPFEHIAGMIFIGTVYIYISHALLLPSRIAVNLILLSGAGSIMAAIPWIYAHEGARRRLEAVSALIGNTLMVLLLQVQ